MTGEALLVRVTVRSYRTGMGRREEREKHVPPHYPPPPASPASCLTSELAFGLGGVQHVSRPVPRGWGGAALTGQSHRKDSFELELAEPGRKPTCLLRLGLSWSLSHVQIRQLLVSASTPERLQFPLGHSLGSGAQAGLSLSGGRGQEPGGRSPEEVPLLSNTTQALGSDLKQPEAVCSQLPPRSL